MSSAVADAPADEPVEGGGSLRIVGTLVLSALALVACASGSEDVEPAADPATTVRLVIPDANLREPGVSCSGASPFRFAHPEAGFVVTSPSGTTVFTGKLPQGIAEKALTIDLGDQRQHTVCVMRLEMPGVDSVDGHSIVIDDRSPVPIVPNPNLDGALEAVLS